jgi:hypothetical protein
LAEEIASIRAKRRSRLALPGLIAYYYILPMLFIELAIVVALILLNGLLALAELAIVSSRRARLQALVDRQVIGSRRALALATDPGRFLSTVQIGITLIGVLSGAFSGATLGLHLAEWFVELGLRASVAEAAGVGLVVAVITYFSLVIGELVPTQIALRDPEKIAVRVAPAMTALARIASPIVSFLDISGRVVLRALGYRAQPEHRVTDEEIRSLMAEAETAGVLEPGERAMIAGVMRLVPRGIAHLMFDLAPLAIGTTSRSGPSQWLAEAVATFTLVLAILGGIRYAPSAIPWLVGLTITAAYWFTASTSFANPAVTLARAR